MCRGGFASSRGALVAGVALHSSPSKLLCCEAYSAKAMTRGNQRDTDRARAAKRGEGKGVPAKEKDGLTAGQRRER